MTIVKNDLFDYKNRYIYQDSNGFKFSLDSILLAEFANVIGNNKLVLDLCSGNAAIPLILSTKTRAKIYGFEIQKEIFDLGKKSIIENHLENQIFLYNKDVRKIREIFPGKYFDVILCNPPYFKTILNGTYNKNNKLSIARHEIEFTLEDIFKISSFHLKDNGDLFFVHRPERIDEIIYYAFKYKLPVKELQLIVTNKNKPKIILIHCQKHRKCGIRFRDVIDITNLKTYQNIFRERK